MRNFWIAAAAVPIVALFMLGGAVMRGLGHVMTSMLVALIQPLLLLAALLIATQVFRAHVSSSDALWLYLGAAVGALVLVVALWRRCERALDRVPKPDYRTSEWFGTATLLMFASGLVYLQGRTGVIISGLFLDARQVGTYAAMERVSDAALLGLVSVNLLAAPSFAALHALGRRSELRRHARLAAWGSTAFMLAAVLPLVVFGKSILRLFGDEFVVGYPVLLVLLGGVAVSAMCGSVGLLLSMTGHQRDTIVAACASLCLTLLLSLALVPEHGILGTSVAIAVSMAAWNIVMLLMVRWRLGIWCCVGPI